MSASDELQGLTGDRICMTGAWALLGDTVARFRADAARGEGCMRDTHLVHRGPRVVSACT
jgi:hypothetical protein